MYGSYPSPQGVTSPRVVASPIPATRSSRERTEPRATSATIRSNSARSTPSSSAASESVGGRPNTPSSFPYAVRRRRSEERRVGKEGTQGGGGTQSEEK